MEFNLTLMIPVFVIIPHPPVNVIVYEYVPASVGVPLMVTTLFAQEPNTPGGNPEKFAPVAPFVE